MQTDLELYDRIHNSLASKDEKQTDFADEYHRVASDIAQWISTEWFSFGTVYDIQHMLAALACTVAEKDQAKAREIFIIKNGERAGLWKDIGMVGALVEIHAKIARLKVHADDEDAMFDLFNYAMIALMSIELGLIKIGKEKQQVAVVTGDTQGLGQGIASIMKLNGIQVLDYGTRDTFQSINAFFDGMEERGIGKIDFLVNNYGINKLNWLGSIEEDDYKVIDVNVKLPTFVVNELVKRSLGPTRILNIASQTYRVAQRCTTLYCASKAAVVQMTKVMARELAPYGYVVNALSPGKIEGTTMTQMTDAQVLQLRGWTAEQADEYALSMIPAGRFTTIEEMSLTAVKILSLPAYVNGCIIDATGGV